MMRQPPTSRPEFSPMKITLGKKIFLYTSSTLVGLLLITFLLLERHQARQWEEYLSAQSLAFARFATPELLKLFRGQFSSPDLGGRQGVYDFLSVNRELVQFAIYNPNGRELFVSEPFRGFEQLPLQQLPPVDLKVWRKGGEPELRPLPMISGGQLLEVMVPAFGPTGEQVLTVRYLISQASLSARLGEIRQQFLRIALLATAASLLLAAMVARRLTGPISALTGGARAIAQGELQTRIALSRGDELGTLAAAFNDMATSLGSSRSELTRKNAELVTANEELRQMQEQLVRTERLAAIGQLAAGISHEIDNPVGIILGYAELLLDDLPPEDERRADVIAIIDECRRCKRITGGLLGFARTSPPRQEPFDLRPLIEQTLVSLRPQKLFREIQVDFPAKGPALRLVGDADQLRQVLVNLLLNAAQAMGGQGRIWVRAEAREDLVVEVEDNGPGIGDELLERIFEPFFSTKNRGEGTGLGLSVCRKLVEAHGGTLVASAGVKGGGLFRLTLPAQAEKCFDKNCSDSLG